MLPLLLLGGLALGSCTVHNHDSGYRGRDHRHDRSPGLGVALAGATVMATAATSFC